VIFLASAGPPSSKYPMATKAESPAIFPSTDLVLRLSKDQETILVEKTVKFLWDRSRWILIPRSHDRKRFFHTRQIHEIEQNFENRRNSRGKNLKPVQDETDLPRECWIGPDLRIHSVACPTIRFKRLKHRTHTSIPRKDR